MVHFLQSRCAYVLTTLVLLCYPLLSNAQLPGKEAARAAKLTPDLLTLKQNGLPGNAAPAEGPQKLNLMQIVGNSVAIEAVAVPGQSGQDLLNELQALGLTQGVAYKQIIFGYLPIDKLDVLRNVSALQSARPAYKPMHNVGAVTSQGDRAMLSDVARQSNGLTGVGVKVGVLSDSYNALGGAPAGVASGDLPPDVQVIDDLLEPGTIDEGRAMIEIVHDIAPGAAIAFNTAFKGQAGFAKGIKDLAAAGCQIITDDIYYYAEPFFQDGIISQAIREVVTNNKVAYFTSAGNSERAAFQSSFVRSDSIFRDPFVGTFGYAHDFGGGDYFQKITIPRFGQAIIDLQWDDNFASVNPGSGAKTDLDLLIYYNGVLRPDLSSYGFSIGGDPVELSAIVNQTNAPVDIELVIVNSGGPDPTIFKWVNVNSSTLTIEYDTKSPSIFGHSNEATAISVGAARYDRTPAVNSTLTTAIIEGFSTAGGTPILFNEAGERLTVPIIRQKPEIVAANGGNNTFFGSDYERDGFPNFFGTSAAAPHAAGVAALMQQRASNTLSTSTILSIMEQTALDMNDPLTPGFDTGFDFRTGYGFIQADRAVQAVNALLSSVLSITGVTTVSCTTVAEDLRTVTFTPQYSGQTSQPVTFSVVNELQPTTSPGPYTLNLYTDNPIITLKATQAGSPGEATFAYNWLAACNVDTTAPGAFGITGVTTVSCATVTEGLRAVTFTPQYNGQNGQPITFSVANELPSTTSPGPYTLNLYTDNPIITLRATQAGTTDEAVYAYNWLSACSSLSGARKGVAKEASLQVAVFGNPIEKESVDVEINGVSGQSVKVELMDAQGRLIVQQTIRQAEALQRVHMPVGGIKGLILLNVGTSTQRQVVKLIKR